MECHASKPRHRRESWLKFPHTRRVCVRTCTCVHTRMHTCTCLCKYGIRTREGTNICEWQESTYVNVDAKEWHQVPSLMAFLAS